VAGRKPIKAKNPTVGVFRFRFRDAKGRYTKSYRDARLYELLRENGRVRDSQHFPTTESKTGKPRQLRVDEKKTFLKIYLTRLIEADTARADKQRAARRLRAQREGKNYRPRETKPKVVSELLGETQRGMEKLAERDPALFDKYTKKTNEEFIVSEKIYQERLRDLVIVARKSRTLKNMVVEDIASSKGKALEYARRGQERKNWVEEQEKIGLLKRGKNGRLNFYQESIRWTVSRFLRLITKDDFEKLRRLYGKSKTVSFKLLLITNLEKHDRILEVEAKTAMHLSIDLKLTGDDWKKSFDTFQYLVSAHLLHTLYATGDYEDRRLTSTEIFFRVRSKYQSSRGKTQTGVQSFKYAFCLVLM